MSSAPQAIVIGVGDGLSASAARLLSRNGYDLTLAARSGTKMAAVAAETQAQTVLCDASDLASVRDLFAMVPDPIRVVIYNPSARVRGPIAELDAETVRKAVEVTAFGAFLAGQQAAQRMLKQEPDEDGVKGTILFTGASAGVKGFPQSASFAMGKFAQRGLAQSMSRELHPQGIHVAWVNIDGGIRNPGRPERMEGADESDSMLDPDQIAEAYLSLIRQHRSVWSEELSIRPWVERF
ncbi:MAG: SDR family NAD(P)-dependent oxidoreductase [Pseudomonadota bacterium]